MINNPEGGVRMERTVELCTPCQMELRRRGRRVRTTGERRRKCTCRLCDKRRYGESYILEDGKK